MKKSTKRILVFSLFAILIASFLIGVVAAATPFDPVRDMFANWEQGQLSLNLAKYLFLILLTLLLYSLFDTFGLVKGGVNFLVSFIVAFLGTAYFAPSEVWGLLTSYNALAATILLVFPLLILFFFTIRIAAMGPSGIVIQYGMWIIYTLFLVYRYIWGVTNGLFADTSTAWVYGAAILIAVAMTLFNRVIVHKINKEWLNAEVESAQNTANSAAAMNRTLRDELRATGASGGRT
jgi:hypothetical protein